MVSPTADEKGANFYLEEDYEGNIYAEIFSKDDDKVIMFSEVHFTCSSFNGKLSRQENYVGLIVYSIGDFDAKKKTGNSIYAGWILVQPTLAVKDIDCDEG